MRFRFIEDRRADYPVTILCDVLGVSPAGYYAWRARPESRRAAADRELVEDIRRVHRDTRGRYGSPRIHVELKAQGRGVSRGRIERLMRHHGIRAIMARPRRVRTTDSRHGLPIAPNLLGRNFFAAAPNRIWLADITYIETDQGWLYLAAVIKSEAIATPRISVAAPQSLHVCYGSLRVFGPRDGHLRLTLHSGRALFPGALVKHT